MTRLRDRVFRLRGYQGLDFECCGFSRRGCFSRIAMVNSMLDSLRTKWSKCAFRCRLSVVARWCWSTVMVVRPVTVLWGEAKLKQATTEESLSRICSPANLRLHLTSNLICKIVGTHMTMRPQGFLIVKVIHERVEYGAVFGTSLIPSQERFYKYAGTHNEYNSKQE